MTVTMKLLYGKTAREGKHSGGDPPVCVRDRNRGVEFHALTQY